MRKAVIYERKGRLFVRSCAETTEGVWIDDGPCVALDRDAPPRAIGSVVSSALHASRRDVAHPASWSHLNDALLQVAGVGSWATFGRTAKCINVEQTDRVVLMPTRNRGSRGGFENIQDQAIELPLSAEPGSVGEAVAVALERCEVA